jgi:hypothetical protein
MIPSGEIFSLVVISTTSAGFFVTGGRGIFGDLAATLSALLVSVKSS